MKLSGGRNVEGTGVTEASVLGEKKVFSCKVNLDYFYGSSLKETTHEVVMSLDFYFQQKNVVKAVNEN